MPAISKPDYTYIWSSGGAIVSPSNVKIQTGWTAEVPPFQWENWAQNRQDMAIAHINQHGIAVWDAQTEYQYGLTGPKSLVMGSDGAIYRAKQVNTNQNPTTDVSDTYWELAFASISDVYTKSQVDAKTTVATQAQAIALTDNTTLMTPLRTKQAFNASGAAPFFAARAWGQFNGVPAVPTGASGNVSSISKQGTGLYQVTFSTNMSTTSYAVITSGSETTGGQNTNQDSVQYYNKTVSGFLIECFSAETSRADFANVSFVVFGD